MKRICTIEREDPERTDEKLEAKVRARTEPYKYANTAVSVDFGGVKQGDQDDEPVSNVDGGGQT